nr:EthD family reductase [uncultured Brevundimonas sp.]
MFKRMSVLVRRDDHSRETFSTLWERHAAPVSQLPGVRGYIQNHVEEAFGAASPIRVDGFVELLWDRPEDMAAAFASEAARPMVEDEPGFLGHGSGYAVSGSELRSDAATKLIVAVVGDGDGVEHELASLDSLGRWLRDDVNGLIPKPGMAPPQPVHAFFHLWLHSEAAAQEAAFRLTALAKQNLSLGVYKVRTVRFV